jgi:signal transduction histidine kinase
MLHPLLVQNREAIVGKVCGRARARANASSGSGFPDADLQQGVSLFLDHLIGLFVLRSAAAAPPDHSAAVTPAAPAEPSGMERLRRGRHTDQLVHTYGDLCTVLLELVLAQGDRVPFEELRTLNQCLDEAVAEMVTQHGRRRELAIAAQETERLGFLAHEMRNLVHGARLAFEILKSGQVEITGSTGAVLDRALSSLRELADRTLAEVRVTAHVMNPERISLATFLREIEATATVEARARDLHLSVPRPEQDIVVVADFQLLASATSNLLQNAFKFTRPSGHVCLTARTEGGRALLEVEDECGGLPPGRPEELFRSFEKRGPAPGAPPTPQGLGLGLSISQKAIEACAGKLHVRDLPGRGCVFTIDLPELRTGLLSAIKRGPAAPLD